MDHYDAVSDFDRARAGLPLRRDPDCACGHLATTHNPGCSVCECGVYHLDEASVEVRVAVREAVSRMRAWAEENPQADTQGLMDDEWAALATAAVEDMFTADQHYQAVRVLRRQLRALTWLHCRATGFEPDGKDYMAAFTALDARERYDS